MLKHFIKRQVTVEALKEWQTVTHAADYLGVARDTVQRRIERYEITKSEWKKRGKRGKRPKGVALPGMEPGRPETVAAATRMRIIDLQRKIKERLSRKPNHEKQEHENHLIAQYAARRRSLHSLDCALRFAFGEERENIILERDQLLVELTVRARGVDPGIEPVNIVALPDRLLASEGPDHCTSSPIRNQQSAISNVGK